MTRILIVEDEPDLRDALALIFEDNGLETRKVGSVRDAHDLLRSHDPDVVMVDLGLPDGSGLDLVRALRRRRPPCGVIIVTGKADPVDRILGLELGADDYVTKPFVGKELVARVRSVARRVRPDDEFPTPGARPARGAAIRAGGAKINVPARIVTSADGSAAVLSAVETSILVLLNERRGVAVDRNDLSRAALGRDWDPEDRTIDQNVSSLRRKLGLPAGDQGPIVTVRGTGYMLLKDEP